MSRRPPHRSKQELANQPAVTRDPRFRAGRTLITQQGADDTMMEQAVTIFATLLENARARYGHDNFETVPAYYEYGNALFRVAERQRYREEEERKTEVETAAQTGAVDRRAAAAAAAERRLQGSSAEGATEDKKPAAVALQASQDGAAVPNEEKAEADEEEPQEENDTDLALEMMETAWSILDESLSQGCPYESWGRKEQPRVLSGIGEVLGSLDRHADAADAFCRSLSYRQEAVDSFLSEASSDEVPTLQFLQCRRRLTETHILLAEALLACAPDQDVTTTESGDTLVTASERVEYARGYYDKARDELQETVLLMGQVVAKGNDIGDEKENVCFVATLVMGVGTTLAEIDEKASVDSSVEPVKKKAKK